MSASRDVPTPGSCARRPTAVVLGAGIAGLTAAHEMVQRGFAVTVYEPRADERAALGAAPPGGCPPVKLGGLAASQYAACHGGADGGVARLRAFPGRRGRPRPPRGVVAGEHGFRFFPAYYLHIWDMLQRIPVYEPDHRSPDGDVNWRPSSRTVMDNVRRVVTQATTVAGKPSLVFPRDAPRSLAELLTLVDQYGDLGFSTTDVRTFSGRLLRYLVTSPLRRGSELQNLSAYDFFIGRDATAARRFWYTPQFESLIFDMPKVLAAFDSRWGDARTNLTTYLQLQLQMDRHDSKVDGVLNGPTTESWFDHWYHHLVELGVQFVRGAVHRLDPPPPPATRVPAHQRPGVHVVLADGTRLAPDYVVCAVDGPAAEHITAALRAAGTRGAVAGLEGFATSVPPPRDPLQPAATRPVACRDPFQLDQLGRVPWDRFQTLAGIQYYFDTEFQLVRGHVYYTGTEWGISSINQHGLWECKPTLARDGYVAVLSVDIGDFNTPSRHLLDEHGQGKAARDCTADELAAEVWRQIVTALTGAMSSAPEELLPWPVWYALDRNLVIDGSGRPVRNEAPYLVPIVGDWPNRPGGEPWNPHGSSWGARPTEATWLDDLERGGLWQARHGGYQVHHNSLVFAGTWTKTFTRMTTMEAACESARHAVNAILDHYIWVRTGGEDRREATTLDWRFPFGFLDQGFSSPVRQPSPAGDYCFVFDIENREPLDTRGLRNLDSEYCRAELPHPLDATAPGAAPSPSAGGPPMNPSPTDYTGQLLTYLQAWRQHLEQATTGAAPPWPTPPMAPGAAPVPQATLPQLPVPSWPAPPGLAVPPPVAASYAPPATPSDPSRPAPPGPPVPPVAVPDPPRSAEGRPPMGTPGPSAAGIREEPGAAHSAMRPPASSLFAADLTTLPTSSADRPVGTAYSWGTGSAASSSRGPAFGQSLYSEPVAPTPAPLRLAQPDPTPSDVDDEPAAEALRPDTSSNISRVQVPFAPTGGGSIPMFAPSFARPPFNLIPPLRSWPPPSVRGNPRRPGSAEITGNDPRA
jgi:uncharacterized protein with NAD-binding domain and iron-sulfur cluster